MDFVVDFWNYTTANWETSLLSLAIIFFAFLFDVRWRQYRHMKCVYGRNHKDVRKVMMPTWYETVVKTLWMLPGAGTGVLVVSYLIDLNHHYLEFLP